MKYPALGSGASKVSPQIASTEVVDPATLKVVMVAPNQHFAQAVVTSALNWDAVEERKAAYDTVQEKIAELVPGVFFVRSTPAVIAGTNVSGVDVYGLGSPLPEEMWLTK